MAEQELEDETIKINGAGKETNQKKRKIPQTEQFWYIYIYIYTIYFIVFTTVQKNSSVADPQFMLLNTLSTNSDKFPNLFKVAVLNLYIWKNYLIYTEKFETDRELFSHITS